MDSGFSYHSSWQYLPSPNPGMTPQAPVQSEQSPGWILLPISYTRNGDRGQCPVNRVSRTGTHLAMLLPQSLGSGESDSHLIPVGKADSDTVFLKHENRMAQESWCSRGSPDVCNLGEKVQTWVGPRLRRSPSLLHVV